MVKIPAIHKANFLLIFFCVAGLTLAAQYDYSIKNYNTENGLPQNEITAMSMDKDGYLWLGTRSGLVRYDGSDFKTFLSSRKNNNSLSTDILYTMYIPADKKLVIKTRRGDVYSIENGRPVLFSDSAAGIRDKSMIPGGYFPSLGLYKQLQRSIFQVFDTKTLEADVSSLMTVNNSDFLIGSVYSDKLVLYKNGVPEKTIELEANPKNFISSKGFRFLLDRQNNLFVYDSTFYQFNKVDVDWKSIESKAAGISESLFYSDPYSGEAFCFYNSMFYLMRYDPTQNLLRFIPQFSIKEKTHFWSAITYDSTNSIFFLNTPNEGFFQVNVKKIQTFNLIENVKGQLREGNIISYAALKTSDSTVVAHNGTQLTVSASGIKINTLGNFFGESLTLGLLKDNSIICTQGNRLYYYSPRDKYLVRHAFNDSFNRQPNIGQILSLYPEGDSVWVSSRDAFYCVTPKSFRILFQGNDRTAPSNPDYKSFHSFFRITKNEALLSNETDLFRLRTSAPYSMSKFPEMAGKFVRHVYPYKDLFFVSAYKDGLYILRKNHFYKVPVSNDLSHLSTCHSTYIDKSGNIWIPTDKGLFKSTATSVIESALEGTAPLFYYYGKGEGIDNTEFNGSGMPTYAVLKNEQLFYPSMGGIVTFKPADLNKKITNAPVFIEHISIDNEEIDQYSDSIYLPANFKYLRIDLSTPHFGEPLNLSLEYNLDSAGWKKVQLSDNQRITLVNIPSGTHLLEIRKRTGFANTDYVYTTLVIHKRKSIFEQFWFAAVLLIAISLLYFFFIKMQTRSINRKRKDLQKRVNEQTAELTHSVEIKDLLISIITHDMITPLRHISMIASLLRRGAEKDPKKTNDALFDIQATSDRIMTDSMSIINWIKYNNKQILLEKKSISLADLVNDTFDVYISLSKNKSINLVNEVPASKFVEADSTILKTILNNILSNAIRHTDSGAIKVFLSDTDSGTKTALKISDTGSGMRKETLWIIQETLKGNLQALKTTNKINTGLGYIMIAELVKIIHNITVTVESEPGKGTIVSLIIDNSSSDSWHI